MRLLSYEEAEQRLPILKRYRELLIELGCYVEIDVYELPDGKIDMRASIKGLGDVIEALGVVWSESDGKE